MAFPGSSPGTGKGLGVSMSIAAIEGGTISGVALSGNTNAGGTTTAQTLLTTTTASTVGFFGAAAVVQPANAAQAALTLTTATASGVGFSSTTGFNAFIAQLENIRASLVLLGLLKGTS
jgi:hypothetical protein